MPVSESLLTFMKAQDDERNYGTPIIHDVFGLVKLSILRSSSRRKVLQKNQTLYVADNITKSVKHMQKNEQETCRHFSSSHAPPTLSRDVQCSVRKGTQTRR